jgi:hypothetical protein
MDYGVKPGSRTVWKEAEVFNLRSLFEVSTTA